MAVVNSEIFHLAKEKRDTSYIDQLMKDRLSDKLYYSRFYSASNNKTVMRLDNVLRKFITPDGKDIEGYTIKP